MSGFDFNQISTLTRLSSIAQTHWLLEVDVDVAHTQFFVCQKVPKQETFAVSIPVLSVQKKTDISAATRRVKKNDHETLTRLDACCHDRIVVWKHSQPRHICKLRKQQKKKKKKNIRKPKKANSDPGIFV